MKRAHIVYAAIRGNRFGDYLMRVEYRGKLLWQSEFIGERYKIHAIEFCRRSGFTHYAYSVRALDGPTVHRYACAIDQPRQPGQAGTP